MVDQPLETAAAPEGDAAIPKPTIAIVIVCRNARAALDDTLRSVRALDDSRVRLVVIDGASDDGTPELLGQWRDSLFYQASERDGGIYDAMNKGWRAAPEHAHVLYLGAGDRILSLPSSEQMLDEDGRTAPIVMGRCQVGDTQFVSRWTFGMHVFNAAHHQALMISKRIWPASPFDTTLRIFADWDFNLRLMRLGIPAKYVGSFQSYALPGGVSSEPDLEEIREVARRHGGALIGHAAWMFHGAMRLQKRWRGALSRMSKRGQCRPDS